MPALTETLRSEYQRLFDTCIIKAGKYNTIDAAVNIITNNKNVYGIGYNKKTNEINTAYQSGFLPNFIYRVNF